MENTETIPKEKYGRFVIWVILLWILLMAFGVAFHHYLIGFYTATEFNNVLTVFLGFVAMSPILAILFQKLFEVIKDF